MALTAGVAALLASSALLLAPILEGTARAAASSTEPTTWSFASAPGLDPVRARVLVDRSGTAPGDLFLAPIGDDAPGAPFYGHYGPLILDGDGNPIWELPLPPSEQAMDFRRQFYRGRPVLTWWQGTLPKDGDGVGEGVIVDSHYRTIAVIHAQDGWQMDPHEFLLTPGGTALFGAVRVVARDLTSVGGPRQGEVLDEAVQEADIRTGHVIWSWDVLRHVPLSESRTHPHTQPWDAFHLNAIDRNAAGDLLVSLKATWTVYEVARRTGRILFRLGGDQSSFRFDKGAGFAWQHDARFLPGGRISLFDNEAAPAEALQSRAIVLWLDEKTHVAYLKRQDTHPDPPLLVGSQGSNQVLRNGDSLVGWGVMPYVSEFDPQGRLLFDLKLPGDDETYRAYRFPWVGRPTTSPSLAVETNGGESSLYASWNGATEVATWQVLAGPSATSLGAVTSAPRSGFETELTVPSSVGAVLEVRALDKHGRVLGTSEPATQPGPSS